MSLLSSVKLCDPFDKGSHFQIERGSKLFFFPFGRGNKREERKELQGVGMEEALTVCKALMSLDSQFREHS